MRDLSMKIKCLICGDIIESKSVHNLVSCKCENYVILMVANDYLHFGGTDFSKILIIFDDGTEVLASDEENYKRKNMKSGKIINIEILVKFH